MGTRAPSPCAGSSGCAAVIALGGNAAYRLPSISRVKPPPFLRSNPCPSRRPIADSAAGIPAGIRDWVEKDKLERMVTPILQ